MAIQQDLGPAQLQQEEEDASQGSFQYDAAWVEEYRRGVAFNALGMLTPTSFTSEQERGECLRLVANRTAAGGQEALESMLARGKERELRESIAQKREPHFEYPAIVLPDVQQHLRLLLTLQERICQREQNAIVRRLYVGDGEKGELGAIPYHLHYLRMIEATTKGDSEAFWCHNLAMNPLPSESEMLYALSRVKWFLEYGLEQAHTRDMSKRLAVLLGERLSLSMTDIPTTNELKLGPKLDVSLYGKTSAALPQRSVSAEAVRAFFSEILHDQGCTGWEALIDYAALTTRLEPGLRHYILAGGDYTINKVIELVAHEWLAHISPRVMGEQRSRLGLLGIGTGRSLTTEEGVGLYYEWDLAKRLGRRFDETKIYLGTLATGLAAGVLVPPQNFLSLYEFFEQFLLLYRLIWRGDESTNIALERARSFAQNRCLRTYRGVPPCSRLGICYSKDAHYARGFFQVHHAVEKDPSVLDWLASGVVALEQIPDLQELGLTPTTRSPREVLERPDLEAYILTFEASGETSPS